MKSLSFFKYFIRHLFSAHGRQVPLLIAILGLFLSSLALFCLQAIMQGLQNGVVGRAKAIQGEVTVFLREENSDWQEMSSWGERRGARAIPELEIELLARQDSYIAPLIIHGLPLKNEKKLPSFLDYKDSSGIILGSEMAQKLKGERYSGITLISPAHSDSFLGDVPRLVTSEVTDFLSSDVLELDSFHGWVRDSLLFNLTRSRDYNRLRFYQVENVPDFKSEFEQRFPGVLIRTWEEQNSTLVSALRLEKSMMLFLFISMGLLVAIGLSSGLSIFLEKIKIELVSFWILGFSQAKLNQLFYLLIHLIGLFSSFLGIVAGLLLLGFLKTYAPQVMPAIFVERALPVSIEFNHFVVALLVPYTIAVFFSSLSFRGFIRENSHYLDHVRAVS